MDPDLFTVKTEAQADSWIYEKMQAVMSAEQFKFSLKALMECQVCILYNPGVFEGDGGWCVTIGTFYTCHIA